jgi:hypothetical protein
LNYNTSGPVTTSIGANINPVFSLRLNGVSILSGTIPVFDVNIALVLTLRTILASGQVIIEDNLELTTGDILDIVYEPDGLTIQMNIGSNVLPGAIFAINSLF